MHKCCTSCFHFLTNSFFTLKWSTEMINWKAEEMSQSRHLFLSYKTWESVYLRTIPSLMKQFLTVYSIMRWTFFYAQGQRHAKYKSFCQQQLITNIAAFILRGGWKVFDSTKKTGKKKFWCLLRFLEMDWVEKISAVLYTCATLGWLKSDIFQGNFLGLLPYYMTVVKSWHQLQI